MINNYLLNESYVDATTILISEEFNSFLKITDAINLLKENTVLESFDSKALLTKLSDAWKRLKEWFKTHVIDKLKDLFQKITSSKLANNLKGISSSAKEKFKNIKLNLKDGKYIPEDASKNIEESINIYNSLTLLNESKANLQLEIMVSTMLKPVVFFNASNYIDFSKAKDVFNKSYELSEKIINSIRKSNESDELSITSNAGFDALAEIEDKLEDYSMASAFKGPLANIANIEPDNVKDIINKDLEARMPSHISFDSVTTIIEDNSKSVTECMLMFKHMANILEKTLNLVNANILTLIPDTAENVHEKIKALNSIKVSIMHQSSLVSIYEDYCNHNYTISAAIGEVLNKLAKVLNE